MKIKRKNTSDISGFYACERYVLHTVKLSLEYMCIYVCTYARLHVCTIFQPILLKRIFTSCSIGLYCYIFVTKVYHTEDYLQWSLGKNNFWIIFAVINPLQTKIIQTYLNIRSVPRRRHTRPRLLKPSDWICVKKKWVFSLRSIQTHKHFLWI